jgi:UDP-glucuronate 4-epimerase
MAEVGPRRVVVTGGAGFIGSTLVDRLLAEGWTVTAVDPFEPFYPRAAKERNIAGASAHPAFTLREVDTRDRGAVREVIERAQPEVVVDLAARAGVRQSIADPHLYIEINVGGLQNTLEAVGAVGARFVFASSSSVYGSDPRTPFREDQLGCRPESPYAASKIAAEAVVRAHHSVTGLPVLIARLFTVYGPRQRPDLAIHHFARRMVAGEPVELFDEGRASRDYTYVDDVVDAFVRMMESDESEIIVNIGSHRPFTTIEVVDALEAALGVRARRAMLPRQPGDVPATFADISRATALLGWQPRWRFEDGVAAFCDWVRSTPS